ncbi:hypothetical protein G7054_g8803 [Neopestalotiopsis clavispora]|nr:hypothetical protein G7054_g8803 [Neopestalotiopsis clavispora]
MHASTEPFSRDGYLLQLVHAGDACRRIRGLADKLCEKLYNKTPPSVLTRLIGELYIAGSVIDGLTSKYAKDARFDELGIDLTRHLAKLMDQLELLCCHPQPVKPLWPSLKALHCEMPWYKLLNFMIYDPREVIENKVRRNLLAFTISPESVQNSFLEGLANFSRVAGMNTQRTSSQLPEDQSQLSERPENAQTILYKTLCGYARCDCRRDHEARLRLNHGDSGVDVGCSFDMLMCSSVKNERHWQDMEMRVELETVVGRPDEGFPTPIPQRVASLCELIKIRNDARLCLEIRDSELCQRSAMAPKQCVKCGPSLPLEDIFKHRRLSNKDRLVLSYIIVVSFWKYYNSQWTNSYWTKRSIHFFEDQQDADGISGKLYANKPYLEVSFQQDTEMIDETFESTMLVHKHPRILGLCLILLEIAQGGAMSPGNYDTVEQGFNSKWVKANGIVDDNKQWNNFDFPDFRKALRDCLDPLTFNNVTTGCGPQYQNGIEQRQTILHEKLVLPIHRLVMDTLWDNAINDGRPMNPIPPSPIVNFPANHSNEQLGHTMRGQENQDRLSSHTWLWETFRFNQIIQGSYASLPSETRRVRVAILDTGYDDHAAFFKAGPRKKRIKEWQDFAGKIASPVDEDGHGTHKTALVMKLAPEADIYVARITKNNEELRTRAEEICEAIKWATKFDVDIISMSFGFEHKVDSIKQCLREAKLHKNDRLLLFAAASNEGANRQEMFPASDQSVISIHQTDTYGDFSTHNPLHDDKDPGVYGTIGKDVPSAWRSNVDGEIPKSGASVSTAIAAGIAATILTYASLGLLSDKNTPLTVEELWTDDGMLAMFRALSVKKDRRWFLSPPRFYADKKGLRGSMLAAMKSACT